MDHMLKPQRNAVSESAENGESNTDSSRESSVKSFAEALAEFWDSMAVYYPMQWVKVAGPVGSDTFNSWAHELRDMTAEQIRAATVAFKDRGSEFVPTLPTFRKLCAEGEQSTVGEIFGDLMAAINGQGYKSDLVYTMAQLAGVSNLREMSNGEIHMQLPRLVDAAKANLRKIPGTEPALPAPDYPEAGDPRPPEPGRRADGRYDFEAHDKLWFWKQRNRNRLEAAAKSGKQDREAGREWIEHIQQNLDKSAVTGMSVEEMAEELGKMNREADVLPDHGHKGWREAPL